MKKIFGLGVALISLFNVTAMSFVDAYESSYTQGSINTSPLFDDTTNYNSSNNYYYNDSNYNNYNNYNYNGCYGNNPGYYTYDYDKDYYEAIKYIDYNEGNCYNNDKGVRYCSARFSRYNYGMSTKYDCTYNYSYKGLYCKFPFEKQTRYISPTTSYTNYFYTNGVKYIIGDNCYARMYVPENAHLTYNGWECNWGYSRIGDSCQRTDSYCGTGYRRVNGTCERMYLPDNAYWINNETDWACYDGYRKNGNYCEKIYQNCGWGYRYENGYCQKVYLPDNAYWVNDGKDWSCNTGYHRVGDHCERYDQSDCGYGYYRVNGYCQKIDDYYCGDGYYRVNGYCQKYDYYDCSWGYKRVNGYCQQVYLPSHAHYTYNGTDWECDSGYYRDGNSCKISQDTVCSMNINYVCGTDNVTYINECFANKNGVSIRYYGDCR